VVRSRSGRPGPSPFSSDYEEVAPPPPRNRPTLPSWLPSGNVLVVALVVLVTALVAIVGGQRITPSPGDNSVPEAAVVMTSTNVPKPTEEPTQVPTPKSTAQPAGPTPTQMPGIAVTPVTTQAPESSDPDAILPKYRVLAYYGHPSSDVMGILGEYASKDELLAKLQEEKTAYEAADPSTPVMMAFELIASVAQSYETPDGTWLLYTDSATIKDYIDFTQQNGMILILDIQIAHSTIKAEMDAVEEWLLYPNVHLAIDPEFAMPEGVAPGSAIGGIDAADITYAQERLAKLTADNNLPPKMLVVHQFYEGMITSDSELKPVPGVQLVIDFDGYGLPANKTTGYTQFITDRPIEFAGIKLFYKQDDPLMTPQEIVALSPPPNVVIYQ
jgi:hypothetical protein